LEISMVLNKVFSFTLKQDQPFYLKNKIKTISKKFGEHENYIQL